MIVIAAVCMTLVLGIAALVIDLGNARAQRRELVTAVDAAALAGGRALAAGESDSAAEAACQAAFADNGVADAPPCEVEIVGSGGTVEATVKRTVDYGLAQIFAGSTTDSVNLRASTTAMVGVPEGVEGLIPLGLCVLNMNDDDSGGTIHQEFRDLLDGNQAVSLTMSWGDNGRLFDNYDDCHPGDNDDGPWAFLDYSGASSPPPRPMWADWSQDGYTDSLPGALPAMVKTASMSQLDDRLALSPIETELEARIQRGDQIIVALYDDTFDVRGDSVADLVQVVGFAVVNSLEITQLSEVSSSTVITIGLTPWALVEGQCCDNNESPFEGFLGVGHSDVSFNGFRMMRICGVDGGVCDG
ncbi:MAG TPA: Tad domain-containing protein [Microthrixaceae bacterium]|nr:Tad domain-containing protein [Microthrixaceae bacterium]